MKKISIDAGIQLFVFLCILLGYSELAIEYAGATQELLDKNVMVSDVEASLNNASEMRDKALEVLSLFLATKALEDAETAALQLTALSENSRLMAEIYNARLTAGLAEQSSNVVTDIVTLPRKAVTISLSYTGRATGNIPITAGSLDIAERLCKLSWSFDRMALERGDAGLKQAASKAGESIRATIKEVAHTADYITGTSENAEEVSLAKELKDRSQNIQYCIIDEEERVPECIGPDCDPLAASAV